MEFFEKAFAWLAEVSQKLPKVDTNLFFIVVLAVIAGLGVVIAFTLLGSRARKLFLSSRKIRKYLANVDAVDDDNVSDFTAHCFSKKTPQALRDAWVQYLGVRFGYPSDIVSDSAVYDKFVKKNKDVRSGIFLGVSLVLLGLFSFWGYGILSAPEMGTVHLAALVLIGALYLVLVILCRKQNQRCLETFDAMQEDLDAKVNLQIESNYATDSSPLQELNSLVEEIIARNTAKAVDIDDENEQTPIEALIEQKMLEQDELDEIQQDDEDSSAQTEEQVLEPVVEKETQDEQDEQASDEQIGINEILQEQEASEEEQNVEEPAPNNADETAKEEQETAEDADAQSEQEENESLEEVPVEDEDIDEEALDETPAEEDTQVEDTTDDENLEERTESVQEESPEEDNQDDNQIEQEPQADNVIEEAPQDEEEYFQAQDNDESDEQIAEQQEEVEGEQNVEDENQEQSDFEAEEESAESEETAEENPQTDESDDNVEQEQSEEVAEEEEEKPENPEEVASEQESNEEENSDEEETSEDEEVEDGEETEDSETDDEPEVVYVVDGDEDEEEHVKPAKLVKLPNLVDYMLSKNMPKAMKIQIATMLIGTYNKFKDSKEDRKIVIQCLTKVMRDLQNNK